MKIFMIGDSTMQFNDYSTYPQVGWGQVFVQFIKKDIAVRIYAKNGRSTKSFIDEGRFDEVKQLMREGDFLIVQFGHNDEKKEDQTRFTTAFGTYQDNLRYFVSCAREKGVTPILISSVYRRHFDECGNILDNVHFDYPIAMKEVALTEGVLYIDVCEKSRQLLMELGDEKSKKLFMNFPANEYINHPQASDDNTHLRYDGAFLISDIVAKALEKAGHPYKDLLCDPVKK